MTRCALSIQPRHIRPQSYFSTSLSRRTRREPSIITAARFTDGRRTHIRRSSIPSCVRNYDFLDRSFVIKNGKTVRVKPNQAMVTNVLDGLRGASHLSGSISAPAWLSHGDVVARKSSHVQMASCICQHSTCFPERPHFLHITRSTSPLTQMRPSRDNGLISCISFGLMTPNPSTHCKSYSDIA